MKLSDYVMHFVAEQGVKDVFMLSGGGCMHLVDSLGRNKDLRYICPLHEQAVAIAAEAYGQYTGLGVALVTTGPGGTNAITGVAGGWLDSTPMLILSGQVKRADLKDGRGVRQMGFQEVDVVGIAQPITKYAVTVKDPTTIRFHLEKAVYLATHGRPGPVWVDIPLDAQAMQIEPDKLQGYTPDETPALAATDLANGVKEALRLLDDAKRPVALLGNGVRLGKAINETIAVLSRLGIPVLTTWKAADFLPDEHPLYAGRPGAIGQRGANFAQQNSDWILVLGARLDLGQTGYSHKNFARGAAKIVVDVDPNEIGKLDMKIDVKLAVDAQTFVKELSKQASERRFPEWSQRIKDWHQKYPVLRPEYWEESGVNLYALMEVLSDEMTGNDVFVPGSSGACSELGMQALKVKPGLRVFNTQGLGAMGFAVPATIGAAIASGKRVLSLDGDGGFSLNIQELETLRRLNLPVKIFVLNNDGYASIRSTQRGYFESRFVGADRGSGVTLPDTVKVAEAYGIATMVLRNHKELREQVRDALKKPGPMIIEVMVSDKQVTQPRLQSAQRPDGTMVSKPLEDLWPFLPREELAANMSIPLLEE